MSMQREEIRGKTAAVWRSAQYASVGIELGISIAIGYWLGGKAQAYWEIAPWGVITGVLLGFASGLRRLMQIAIAESKRAPHLPTAPDMTQDHAQDHAQDHTPHNSEHGEMP